MGRNKILKFLQIALEQLGAIDSYFANPYRRIYSIYPASNSVKSSFYRLRKEGLVETFKLPDGTLEAKITKRAEGIVPWIRLYRLSRKKWDGYWRVVAFDIPEESRKVRRLIRMELRQLGFRQFQRSIWISPLPIRKEVMEFLASLKLGGRAIVFETKNLWVGDMERMIERVFGLDVLRQRWNNWIRRVKKGKGNKSQLKEEFVDLVVESPLLPVDLYPQDWPVEKACRVYVENLT